MDILTKQCSLCKKIKNSDDFYSDKTKKSGLSSQCKECILEKDSKIRERRVKNGLCISCGKDIENKNIIRCNHCQSIANETSIKLYKKEKASGICVICGKTNDSDGIMCLKCAEYQNRKKRQIRDNRIENGLCIYCGKENDNGNVSCNSCAKKVKYNNSRPEIRNRINKTRKNKMHNDINFKLSVNLRKRLQDALKNNIRTGSAVKDLGCSIEELKEYIENQFLDGMNWSNWGKISNNEKTWNIDHIIPFKDVDISKREDLLKVCHYTNLRPLWAKDNVRRNKKQRSERG